MLVKGDDPLDYYYHYLPEDIIVIGANILIGNVVLHFDWQAKCQCHVAAKRGLAKRR